MLISIGTISEGYTNINELVPKLNEYPWPIGDNEIEGMIVCRYFDEVPDVVGFMAEIHRICKPESKIQFMSYYYASIHSYTNPMSVRHINEFTFTYFNNENRKANALPEYPFDFKLERLGYKWRGPWEKKSEEAREYAKEHYWNVIDEILVELEVIKNI
jgi:ubiquinone/menaquinone biosynthesis C-methylase UbiE